MPNPDLPTILLNLSIGILGILPQGKQCSGVRGMAVPKRSCIIVSTFPWHRFQLCMLVAVGPPHRKPTELGLKYLPFPKQAPETWHNMTAQQLLPKNQVSCVSNLTFMSGSQFF